jgi:hypothetical protein
MKTFLVVAAVFGMTSSAALAECAGHVSASKQVDKEFTTASIAATPAQDELKQANPSAEPAQESPKVTQ